MCPAFILPVVTERPISFPPLYATTFMVGLVMISLGPLLDAILRDLSIPLSQGGFISVSFAVGMLLGVLALNFAFARVPAKWLLMGAAWLQTLGLVTSALLAHGLWSLFATYIFVGAGCVFLNSLPGMWVASHVKTRTDRAMVVLLLWFAVGMMVGPLAIGGALGLGVTWRWVFGAEGVLSFALAILLTVMPVSDIEGRENLRLRQLRDVIGFNPRLFIAVLTASILYIGSEFILNVWLAKFEIDVFGVTKTVASFAVTLFWVGLIIGRTAVIPLTRRYSTSRLLLAGMAVMSLFSLGVALSTSPAMSMVMSFMAGLGSSACFALILSYSGRFPRWHAGVVFSAVIMAGALGRIVFPYIVGPIAHSLSFRIAIGLAFLLAGLVAVMAIYLRRVSGELDEAR